VVAGYSVILFSIQSIMQKIKPILSRVPPFFIIGLLSAVVTIINLGFKKSFLGDDAGVAFHFPNTLKDLTFYMWDSHHAPGKMNLTATISLSWHMFILLLYKLKLSGFIIERILFFLFLFVSGTGTYLLIGVLFRYLTKPSIQKYQLSAILIGSIFYMFNHYTMALMSIPIFPYHLSYMLLPWLFYALILNLFSQNNLYKTIIFTFIFLLLSAGNPSNTISISLFLFFFVIWFRKDITDKRARIKSFATPFILIFTLVTSYIWLPILLQHTNPYGIVGKAGDFYASTQLHSTYTSIPNILRLAGIVTWESFPYFKLYNQSPFFVILSFLPILLALIPLLSTRNAKLKFFFLIVFLVSIFFAKGLHPPFRELFLFIFTKIPLYGMYRAVYPKFTYYGVLAVSVLISFGILTILSHWQNRKIIYLVFIMILLSNIPFFMGQIPQPELLTQIPKIYQQVKEREHLNNNYRILSLPVTPNGSGPIFKWRDDYYVGPPTDMYFFDQEVVESFWFIKEGFKGLKPLDSWRISRLEKDFQYFIPLLKILNIKYLLLHKDNPEYYKFTTSIKPIKIYGVEKAKILTKQLINNANLKVISKNEYFDIYETNSNCTLPKFYIPEVIVKNSDQLSSLEQILSSEKKERKMAILPLTGFTQASGTSSIHLQIDKINPTLYQLSIDNPKNLPFFLIFSESYNTSWEALIGIKSTSLISTNNQSSFFANLFVFFDQLNGSLVSIDETQHLTANSYANAWFIDSSTLPSADVIYISFKPQLYFIIGFLVSITCISVLLVSLIIKSVQEYVIR